MDQIHQDHLQRILEKRRKRGISASRFASAADKGRAFYVNEDEATTPKAVTSTSTKGCQFNSANSTTPAKINPVFDADRAKSPEIAAPPSTAPPPTAVRPDLTDYQILERKLQQHQQDIQRLEAKQNQQEQENKSQLRYNKQSQERQQSYQPSSLFSNNNVATYTSTIRQNTTVNEIPHVVQRTQPQLIFKDTIEQKKVDPLPHIQNDFSSPKTVLSLPAKTGYHSLVPPSTRRGLLGRFGGTELSLGGISATRAKGGKVVTSSAYINTHNISENANANSATLTGVVAVPTLTEILNENPQRIVGHRSPSRNSGIAPRPAIPYKYGILPPPLIQYKGPSVAKPKYNIMDPRAAVSILRTGDWFYKWNDKWTQAETRYVWLDVNRYVLLWGKEKTQNSLFGGFIELESLTHVTTDQIQEFDGDVSRIFFILRLHNMERSLYLATEKREKLDCWYEALNAVILYYKSLVRGGIKAIFSD